MFFEVFEEILKSEKSRTTFNCHQKWNYSLGTDVSLILISHERLRGNLPEIFFSFLGAF